MSSAAEVQAWLLAHFGNETFTPGLARVEELLAPELQAVRALKPRIVTIAGTNGKGETAHTLARMARAQGLPFVLWTSPHLLQVTERLQSEAGEITADELQTLLEQGHHGRLSYYEALWSAFLRWGVQRECPLWIIEVGLGGRLDAVNLLDAQVVGLCSVSRDHQELLGRTYRQILHEKLAVLRRGAQLVSALESQYLREQTGAVIQKLQVEWLDLFDAGVLQRESHFSQRNRGLAQHIWRTLGQADMALPTGPYPGRGEVWRWGQHLFTFYGSHNPDGVRKLVQFLQSGFYTDSEETFHHVWAAFSLRPPKDLGAMGKMLSELSGPKTEVRFTQFDHPKAAPLEGWWHAAEGSPAQIVHVWNDLFKFLSDKTPQKILVTGSYYFVGAVQSHLLGLGGGKTTSAE